MKSIEVIYLLFAIAHPVSELIDGTNLRKFLNETYYRTNRDDFPVNKTAGIGGSLLVLAILVIPLLASLVRGAGDSLTEVLWYLAFGLVLADLIQHAAHVVARPRKLAPWVHLLTILGVLIPLLSLVEPGWDVLQTRYLLPLLFGALIIFANWANNSRIARLGAGFSGGQPTAPAV